MNRILRYILFLSILLFSACASLSETQTPSTEPPTIVVTGAAEEPLTDIPLAAGYGVKGSWFELYFTNPLSPMAKQKTGGPDGPLVSAIDAARVSVDAAIYSLSLDSARNAFIRAHNRGVQVRLVMESDNMDNFDVQKVIDAGIPVLGDRHQGLMHNKFVVIDNAEVWTGSMNLTDSGTYGDNNNFIRIHSAKMAEDYTHEFNQMFVDDKFGPDKVSGTPNPRVTIDGVPIDVYFSPEDHIVDSLLDLVNGAQQSIYFLAYSFTSDPLGEAIRSRAAAGVTVEGVMDHSQVNSNVGTEFDPFRQAGLDVRRDGNQFGLMHHKVMVIDSSIVVTGSYNFTDSAEKRNDENLIVIYDPQIAAQYLAEFQRVYAQATP